MTTPKRAKPKVQLMQLYEYAPCSMKIDTQYGLISYKIWLQKEKRRIEGTEGRVAEVVFLGNAAALFVNRVARYEQEKYKSPYNL